MVIRGRAPLRVSFGGGGTDVAPFCEQQGGAIIGSTINKYAYCSIVPRKDDQIIVHSLDFDMTVKYNTNENYVYDGRLDLVTAALKAMDIKQGCEVYLQCDAPPGSGLGTSSTVMVAMLTAMARWKGIMLDAYAMADLAYEVEREDLKIDGGYQDQYAATFGGFNFIEFHGRNNVVVNPLRIKKDIIHELQYNLLLCYTGKIHVSANIIKDQVQNYEKKDAFDLAVSIPWCVGQVPISYWDIKTGHVLTADNLENRFTSRYMDIPNTPLYPFGFGLSYTEFDVSDVEVRMEQDKRVHVHCKVSNTGNVAGAEVVQCYYETLHASVVRPKKELVRFQKVFLDPGEKKNVDFYIDQKEFSYYDKNMEIVSSGMQLRMSAGNSSDHEWGSSELYI